MNPLQPNEIVLSLNECVVNSLHVCSQSPKSIKSKESEISTYYMSPLSNKNQLSAIINHLSIQNLLDNSEQVLELSNKLSGVEPLENFEHPCLDLSKISPTEENSLPKLHIPIVNIPFDYKKNTLFSPINNETAFDNNSPERPISRDTGILSISNSQSVIVSTITSYDHIIYKSIRKQDMFNAVIWIPYLIEKWNNELSKFNTILLLFNIYSHCFCLILGSITLSVMITYNTYCNYQKEHIWDATCYKKHYKRL